MDHADAALLERLVSKEERAFRELMDDYGKRVYNTCLGFLKNEEDAEDVTQEVFIEVFKSIASFERKSSVSTWIYRITITKCLDHQKAAKAKKRFAFVQSLFGLNDEEHRALPNDMKHPGIVLEDKERVKILFQAIESLGENQRIAFTLCNVEGLTYKEIAEVMEISVASVESLLFRAKKNLQTKLENYYKKNK